jgi:rod shape-determining protein MreC
MQNLFQFLSKNQHLLLFILLETIALSLVIQNNSFHRSAFINSTNGVTTSVYKSANNINSYFSLKETNQMLLQENAKLRSTITYLKKEEIASIFPQHFIAAEVINNSVSSINNYITLDKGSIDGVEKGMGIISENGVVGIVKETSKNFCSVMSILNSKFRISVELKKNNHLASLVWNGKNYRKGKVNEIPIHVQLSEGDTIVTSGYSTKFPKQIPIGTISKITTNENENFHKVEILFIEDFKELKYVNICHSLLEEEKTSLEEKNNE